MQMDYGLIAICQGPRQPRANRLRRNSSKQRDSRNPRPIKNLDASRSVLVSDNHFHLHQRALLTNEISNIGFDAAYVGWIMLASMWRIDAVLLLLLDDMDFSDLTNTR